MARTLIYITLLGFIPYFVLVWRARELRWNRVRATILTFAILWRLGMLAAPAILSNDTPRYLWDGRVLAHGYNPYRHAPNDPALEHLRDANWERLDHREVPGVYPPLLMVLFATVAAVSPKVWWFKVLFMVFDLLTFLFLVRLLRKRQQNESLALIWALNPLVVLEFAGMGHEMSLAILLYVMGLWLWEWKLTPFGALAFGGAVLAHLLALPVVVVTLIALRVKVLRLWLWFVLPVALGYACFASAGQELWLGLIHFAGRWQFNGSLFEILAPILDSNSWQQVGEVWIAHRQTKFVSVLLVASLLVWVVRRRVPAVRAALLVTGAILLLGSTIHPWYITWLVALAVVEFSLPALLFSACVVVSYVARLTQLETGVWVDAGTTRWLEYGPLYAWLVVDVWRKRLTAPATPASI